MDNGVGGVRADIWKMGGGHKSRREVMVAWIVAVVRESRGVLGIRSGVPIMYDTRGCAHRAVRGV